jgi:hypothetical protein
MDGPAAMTSDSYVSTRAIHQTDVLRLRWKGWRTACLLSLPDHADQIRSKGPGRRAGDTLRCELLHTYAHFEGDMIMDLSCIRTHCLGIGLS